MVVPTDSISVGTRNFNLQDSESINLIVKVPGTACNFNCLYCFEHIKSVPQGDHGLVSLNEITEAITACKRPISLIFHGGEPLLAPIEYYRKILVATRENPAVQVIKIQTNGSLLTQAHIDLFWREFQDLKVEIAISIDGPTILNGFRLEENAESYDNVVKSFMLLNENDISAGLLSVVHSRSLGHAADYVNFLKTIPNIRFVKLNGLHLLRNKTLTADSITPSQFATYVCNIFHLYLKANLYERFPIEPILGALQSYRGEDARYCNFTFRKCHNFVCLYPEGILTLCDSLPADDFKITTPEARDVPLKHIQSLLIDCLNCKIADFCKGGCLGIRYALKDIPQLYRDYCKSRLIFYNLADKLLGE